MDKKVESLLQLSESDLAKRKAIFKLLKLQREGRLTSRLLRGFGTAVPLITGLASLAVSLVSIISDALPPRRCAER
jgi:hypothetical protein